jgi:pyruvate kinase
MPADMKPVAFILVNENSGWLARRVAKYRPTLKILGCSTDEKVCSQLNACRGIFGCKITEGQDLKEVIAGNKMFAKEGDKKVLVVQEGKVDFVDLA